jgi:3-hydroxyisobutyrate dehydrogenase
LNNKVGFVGLGIMGAGMAGNLVKAGYDVTVYNRTRAKAADVEKLGARVADSPADAARGAAAVVTMLADPPAIREAVLGANGVIQTLESGSVLIDCSTVDPETTAACLAACEAKGAGFLDSPVTGSKPAAEAGELVMMVGGSDETLAKAMPVLEAMSSKVIHAGPSGSGTMIKLCFNLFVSHMAASLAEALVLGVKSGLKPEKIIEAIMAGKIQSPYYEWKGGCMMDRDFSTNFSTKLMHKDTAMIMSAAFGLGVPLPVTAAVKELFQMAKSKGLADEDFCSVVKVIEEYAGVEVKR